MHPFECEKSESANLVLNNCNMVLWCLLMKYHLLQQSAVCQKVTKVIALVILLNVCFMANLIGRNAVRSISAAEWNKPASVFLPCVFCYVVIDMDQCAN